MSWRFGGLRGSHKLPDGPTTRSAHIGLPRFSTSTRPCLAPQPAACTATSGTSEQSAAEQHSGRQRKQRVAVLRSRQRPSLQSRQPPQLEAEIQPAEGVRSAWQQPPGGKHPADTQQKDQSEKPSDTGPPHAEGRAGQSQPGQRRRADVLQTVEAPQSSNRGKYRKQKQRRDNAAQPETGKEAQGSQSAQSGQTSRHQQPQQRRPSGTARRHRRPAGAARQPKHETQSGDHSVRQQAAAATDPAQPSRESGSAEPALLLRKGRRRSGLELLLDGTRGKEAEGRTGWSQNPAGYSAEQTAHGVLTSLGMGPSEAEAVLEGAAEAASGPRISAAQAQHVCAWLASAGVSLGQLAAVMHAYPAALAAQPHRDWLPKVEFLRQLGLSVPQIERMTRRHPSWLVGTNLQQLPETAAAVRKAGISRERVPATLYKHPAILSRPPAAVLATGRVLGQLLGSPGAAVQAVPRHPQLLSVDLPAQHLALLEALTACSLSTSDAAQIIAGAPELLAEDARTFQPVLSLLREQGFEAGHIGAMLSAAPRLLLQNAASMRTRLMFLLQHRGKPSRAVIEDIVRYPRYFEHSLVSCIGPRLAFMQARGMADQAAKLSLAYLFSRSDTDFAEQVCSSRRAATAVLIEDYLVWKAQWERTHGIEYGWRPPDVRSVVQPLQAVGAEGRFAVV